MKQITLDPRTGKIDLEEVPSPAVPPTHLLIESRSSVLSTGTERSLVEFGESSLVEKIRQQPERVKQVADKLRSDGIVETSRSVRAKLDEVIPLGYSSAGTVVEVGREVRGFKVGDRVISNGPHAEMVSVPQNLCAKIPESVGYDEAAFTVIGSIALQGIRLAQPTLGETFAVTGLGLVGLMTVQLLRINGCRVLGIDLEPRKLELARRFGAEVVDISKGGDVIAAAEAYTGGRGVDGVLLTATTKSSKPVHEAARMCRKRGRIILVGVTGLDLSRADFYEKELTFQVSCSYGPGRYDTRYELKGQDYPFGYVRWTEQRNFEAILQLMSEGKFNVNDLITHRFGFDRALDAYKSLKEDSSAVGIILAYGPSVTAGEKEKRTISVAAPPVSAGTEVISVGVIGSGSHARQVLLPALAKAGVHFKSIASTKGISSTRLARKFGFETSTTDVKALIEDPQIQAVVVATRHDSHARYVADALTAGKHVFVEKPLAISETQLEEIESTIPEQNAPILMVGFNRRFAPHVVKMKELLDSLPEPKSLLVTVNAGFIESNHWVHDPEIGGGRIIGEGCHFIDLLRYLAGSRIVETQSVQMGTADASSRFSDRMTFTLKFEDGSFGTVHYLANGNRRFPKERVEVFCGGRILHLNNFRKLKGFGWSNFSRLNLWSQDKGHRACVRAFVEAVRDGLPSPIPYEELAEVTRISFDVVRKAR
ncbi:MAG: bi-domain-containing oxidoreductase [Fidelibacterota bacterium]